MDIKTKIKEFIKYAREVCLQNLFLADNIKVDLKNQDNLYEVERIEKEIIPVYENIYLSLDKEILFNLYKENKKVFDQLKKTIDKMKKDSNLKDEYIKTQIKKREDLKGKSGAEVVEKFFKYKIKELKKIKGDLLEKINKLLDKEEKLNSDLSNAIQEVEQLEIMEKLQPIRAEFRKLSIQLDKYQKELEETDFQGKNKRDIFIETLLGEVTVSFAPGDIYSYCSCREKIKEIANFLNKIDIKNYFEKIGTIEEISTKNFKGEIFTYLGVKTKRKIISQKEEEYIFDIKATTNEFNELKEFYNKLAMENLGVFIYIS